MRFWRDLSIQNKVLVIILPLIIVPMLISRPSALSLEPRGGEDGQRYLTQREADLRTIAENPAIPSYFNNKSYAH